MVSQDVSVTPSRKEHATGSHDCLNTMSNMTLAERMASHTPSLRVERQNRSILYVRTDDYYATLLVEPQASIVVVLRDGDVDPQCHKMSDGQIDASARSLSVVARTWEWPARLRQPIRTSIDHLNRLNLWFEANWLSLYLLQSYNDNISHTQDSMSSSLSLDMSGQGVSKAQLSTPYPSTARDVISPQAVWKD